MVRWTRRAWAALICSLALAGAAGSAHACWNCSIWGCVSGQVGFLYCRTVVLFEQPTCFASGLCPAYPFGVGGASDDFPKLRRPVIAGDPTNQVDHGELTVFALTLPCTRGCGVFGPGETSRVLRGMAAAGDAHAMLGALVRSSTDPDPDLRVANAEIDVGPGEYRGAFTGASGSGYALRAARAVEGVATSLCSIEDGLPGRALASEILGPDDLLLVRLWLEDQECIVACSALTAGLANEINPERTAERRRAFFEDSRALTRRGRHPGFHLESREPDAFDCR